MTTAAMATTSSSRTTPAPAMAPAEKPENFFGVDFKFWHGSILTYCAKIILSYLEDGLCNVYSVMKTSKELWNSLEKKYKMENAGLKKFVAAKFLDFKMVDSKSVITQVQELQVIFHDHLAEGINRINIVITDIYYIINPKFMIVGVVINEAFQVTTFIEKLPPMRKVKHKRKEMTLEDLIVRLRIEEDNKAAEKKSRENSTIMGANIIEEASTSKKRKKSYGIKNYPSKKKFKGNFRNYGTVGQKAAEYRAPTKDKKKSQENMIEKNDEIDDLCAMLLECNLVGNPREWWIESRATRHVCANKELFTFYAPAGPDEIVFMANSTTTKVEEMGKIALEMTSGKIVALNDVLHVPLMRKNLVLISLLVKNGFKCVFVFDKINRIKIHKWIRFGGGAVSWKTSKQTCIARSITESEFIALDKAGEEAEWLRNFFEDIPCWPKPLAPICIHTIVKRQ
ncbi:PREDICTED: uncharacterized protein LOC109236050 [Nicotiana attenuata]|uniref:uncharacterized protein LOC109236050 n=1 Tax=Nicotiana attenuata TaxID=49451 RepID=UPI000905B9F9|nr:PREDICTED: uncharacterized protein LOC109236050 [Nicotiana attenuata]